MKIYQKTSLFPVLFRAVFSLGGLSVRVRGVFSALFNVCICYRRVQYIVHVSGVGLMVQAWIVGV